MSHNILLIEDNAADAKSIRDVLSASDDQKFAVEWVRRRSEGLARLADDARPGKIRSARISAVLADLFLSDSQGIETFDRILLAASLIPIVVLSLPEHEASAALAVRRGAQDYVLKGQLDARSLLRTLRNTLERASNADALFDANERARATLSSIGDAVVSTDVWGKITYLNIVAERLTGWSTHEAMGLALEDVVRIVDDKSRAPAPNPVARAMLQDKPGDLPPNSVLICRDGTEAAIEDSAAPIHDRHGIITGAVMVFRDVTVTRAMAVKLSHLAEHDGLTDLPNRVLLNDRLSASIALANRYRRNLAALFINLDRFKHINDSLGHAIGDRVLQCVARRLRASVRASDTVSRPGGDEFVVLMLEVKRPHDAAVGAEKILAALRAPYNIDHHKLYVTASIGIAAYPEDGTSAEELLTNADFAMHDRKENGRDGYRFFEPGMNVNAVARQSLESDLRHALDRDEFTLHYQPKFNLKTGAIVSVEALLRWNHPARGVVSPAQFIPIAEECGFIIQIGQWVLSEACSQARDWQLAGLALDRIAVNTSAVELRAKDFVEGVHAILTKAGLEPRCLELELTETFLMHDSNSTAAVLQALKRLGVTLALDDFGTGYSSLSYLKRFPIDTLKIDRSFVRNLTTDIDDASIVSAVISMGANLGMRVVAEGIETREQLEFLQARRCPEGQGYYFSPPVIASELKALLKRRTVPLPWRSGRRAARSFNSIDVP